MNSDIYITSFVAKLVSNTSVTLSWSGKFNTVNIRSSINNVNYNTIVENYSGTSYTINGLEENMFYYINITPYDANNNAGISDVLHVITNYNPHITRVTTGTATDTIIPLSWSGVYYNIGLTYNRTGSTKYNVIYPISGTSSYTVTGLDASTSYVFEVVPYDINDISGPSYTISASTDYVSYITNVSLGAITARSINISCTGLFSYLNFQYSRDNSYWTTAALMNSGISTEDNYTFLLLDPSSTYYFRVYPYSSNFNTGLVTPTVVVNTLAGFTNIYVDKILNEQIDISLNGRYSSFDTYVSTDNAEYSYFSTVNAPSSPSTYIYSLKTSVTGLTPFTEYYIYFQPYNESIYGTSSEVISVRTDYDAQADVTTGSITTNSIDLNFGTSNIPWPYYHHCSIKISEDGQTYYDLSMIYSVPTEESIVTYNANTFNGQELRSNYTYYFMINPYSHLGTKSPYVYYVSRTTIGNIEANAITYGLDDNTILFIWTGYYKSTLIEYTTDNFEGTEPINSIIINRDATISPMEKDIITTFYYFNDLSPTISYYFRLTPINYDGDYGEISDVHYVPTINAIYITDILSNSIVLNWDGTYDHVAIKTSVDNVTFTTYQTDVTGTSINIPTDGYTTKYYQVVPYNNFNEAGLVSDTTYNPTVISIATNVIDSTNLLISWNGYYDYVIISYSTNDIDYEYVFTDPVSQTYIIPSIQNSLQITPSLIPDFNTNNNTFYFKITPYKFGTPIDNIITGLDSTKTYNATVTDTYFGTINYFTITLFLIGVYKKVIIYYDTNQNFTSGTYVENLIPSDGSSYRSEIFTGLSSNTLYYFKVIPFNSLGEQGYIISYPSAKTMSLLDGLNFDWSPVDSSQNYLTMKWTNNGYSRITIYDSSGTFKHSTSTQTYFKDTGLIPNRTYSYYVFVYDYNNNHEVSPLYYGYTNPSDTNLNFKQVTNLADVPPGYTLSARRILFTWSISPYYNQITITNASTASNPVTFSVSGGIYAYDSYTYEGGLLMQNKAYIYTIKLTGNNSDAVTTYRRSFTTFGSISNFGIIHSLSTGIKAGHPGSYLITDSSLPVSFTGIFNGVILNVSDGTRNGNVAIYGLSSGSNAFSYVYTIDSTNSIVSEANKYYGVQIYTINDASNTILSTTAPTYAYTLSKVTAFSEYAIVDNSTVLLYWDGSYNSVTLETSASNNFTGSPVRTNRYYSMSSTKTYYVPDLESNKKYYFRLTPINQPLPVTGDVSGTTVTWDVSATTMGKITYYALGMLSDITSSAIPVTWDGSYASVFVSVSTDGGLTYGAPPNGYNFTGKYGIATNLSYANYLYYIQINPINNNGLYSNINTRGVFARTLSKITAFSEYAIVDFSTVLLYWDGSYNSVTLETTIASDFTSSPVSSQRYEYFTPTNTYYVPNLEANQKYYFRLTPINQPTETSGDISGVSVKWDVSATTMGKITSFGLGSVSDISSDTIPLAWDGSYASVFVSVSTDGGVTYGAPPNGYNFTGKNGAATNLSYANYLYYFQINPINSNGLYSNINTRGVFARTLGKITAFSEYDIVDSSTVLLYWDGSYNSVTLETTTASDFTSSPVRSQRYEYVTPTNTYYVPDLEANQKYYFRLTPINQTTTTSGDVSGISVTWDVSATTMGKITDFKLGNLSDISASAISLEWDGSFSWVSIGVSTDEGVTYNILPTLYTGKYAVINLEYANYLYYFGITPINSEGLYSNVTTTGVSATSLSKVTSFEWNNIADSSSISLFIDGSFVGVTVDESSTSDFSTFISHDFTNIASNKIYVFDGLSSNTTYYFRARPYNQPTPTSGYLYGHTSDTIKTQTYATITSFASDVANTTSTSIPLNWDGSFNYVVVKISSDGGSTYPDASSVLLYEKSTTFSDLSIFKTYYFRIYPYNDISAAGVYVQKTGTTLGYIGNVYASNITSTGFTVNLSDATFSSFDVFNYVNNKTYPAVTYPNTSLTMNDLLPNTVYTVTAYAYNYSPEDGCGNTVPVTLSNVKTLASITGIVNDISSDSYSVSLIGSYTSFKIRYTVNDIVYDSSYVGYGNKIYVYDLQPNTIYYYTVYANNLEEGTGSDITAPFNIRTLGILSTKFYPTTNYAGTNSITFNVLQSHYEAIRINTATDLSFTNIIYSIDISYDDVVSVYNNIYTQGGLSENTKYYFIAIAIDISNIQTETSTTLYLSTLGNLYSFAQDTSLNITSSSIPIKWNGTYYKTMIEYKSDSAASYSTYGYYNNNSGLESSSLINGNTIVSGLLPNTQYNFRATPLSLDVMSGTSKTITDTSAVTLGVITNVNNTSFYDTSASFIIDGSFTEVKVYSSPASLEKYYSYTNGGVNTNSDISGLLYDASYVFYFLPINSYGVSNPINGAANISYTIRTRPKLTKFYLTGISAITSTSIGVTWDGSFDSVQVDYSTDGVIYNTANSQATGYNLIVSGLNSNTRYYFRAIPSKYGVTGSYVYISDTSSITYGYIKTLTTSIIDNSAISLAWDGSFNSVNVYTSTVAGTYSSPINITGYSTLITELLPNTRYYFKVTAINDTGESSAYIQDVTGLTYGYMKSLTAQTVDTSAVRVTWDGSFSTVKLYYSLTEGTYTSANSTTYSSGTYSATLLGLAANTKYFYKVAAVNATGEGSIVVQDVSAVTLSYIKSLTAVGYDSSAITVTWDGSYSLVNLYYSLTSGVYTAANLIASSSGTSAFISNLHPNTTYYYKAVSVNANGVIGNIIVQDVAGLTYGYMNSLTAQTLDTSAVIVTWDGSFSTVKLYYSLTEGTYTSANSTTYSSGTYSATLLGLAANTKYFYKVAAVNSTGEGSIVVQDVSAVTSSYIKTLTAVGFDSSAITVTWDGSYSLVNLYYSLSPGVYTAANLIASYSGTSTLVTGLIPNTTYYYKAVSVNANGVIGNIIVQDVAGLTYGYMNSLTAQTLDTSAVIVTWDGSFSTVKLYYSLTEGTYTSANSTTYSSGTYSATLLGLAANTRYYYKVAAVNSNGEGNIAVQDVSAVTSSYMKSLTAVGFDSSAITVAWDGSYSLVNLYYSLMPGVYTQANLIASYSGTSSLVTGLHPNTTYYYKAVSVNANGVLGNIIIQDVAGLTYGYMKSFTAQTVDTSAVTVTWDGSFSTVKLYYSLTAGSYTSANSTTYSSGTYSATLLGLAANTRYYYKVAAVNSNGEGNITIQDVNTVTYSYMKTLTAVGYDSSAIAVTWDGSFSSVNLYSSLTAGVYTNLIASYSGVYSTLVTGLDQNTKYYYKAVSVNANGVLGPITIEDVSATTKSLNIYNVNIATVVPIDNSAIRLTWETSYPSIKIYYSTTANTFTPSDSITLNSGIYSTIFNSLSSNTQYYYRVVATDLDGINYYQDTSGLTYSTITKLLITGYDNSSVTFTWDGSYSSVNVYYNSFSADNYNKPVTTNYDLYPPVNFTGKGGTFSGLISNTLYYFKAAGVNTTGVGKNVYVQDISALTLPGLSLSFTKIVSYTTYGTANDSNTPSVTNVSATAYDISSINLTWEGSYSSVYVYYSTTQGIYDTTKFLSLTDNSVLINGLNYYTTYYFRITPAYSNGIIGLSIQDVSAITYSYLTSFVATPLNNRMIALAWNTSVYGVNIYYSTTEGVYDNLILSITNTYSLIFTGFDANKTYYFKATAFNQDNTISNSIQDVSALTYPTITKLSITTYDSSSVSLIWDGSYSTVNVYYNVFPSSFYNKTVSTNYSLSPSVTNFTGSGGTVVGLDASYVYCFKAVGVNNTGLGTTIYKQDVSALILPDPNLAYLSGITFGTVIYGIV